MPSTHTRTRRTERGVSLARGPALVLGTVLLIAGLYFIYREHGFPLLSHFPNGTARVNGKAFFGIFGLNGWSGELTAAAGGLLLFGAAQHHLAKLASLIVAVVLAGVGIWALVNHHSALGLFAANIWTIILWFAAAALLFINALMPRTGGKVEEETTAAPVATRTGTTERRTVATEPRTVQTTEPRTVERSEPARVVNEPRTVPTEPTTVTREPVSEPTDAATTDSPPSGGNSGATLRRR